MGHLLCCVLCCVSSPPDSLFRIFAVLLTHSISLAFSFSAGRAARSAGKLDGSLAGSREKICILSTTACHLLLGRPRVRNPTGSVQRNRARNPQLFAPYTFARPFRRALLCASSLPAPLPGRAVHLLMRSLFRCCQPLLNRSTATANSFHPLSGTIVLQQRAGFPGFGCSALAPETFQRGSFFAEH